MFNGIMDMAIVVLESFCCQMFFDTFHDDKRETPRIHGREKAIAFMSIACLLVANLLRHQL